MQKNFSYPLTVADLPLSTQTYKIRADKGDLKKIAEILKIPAVNSLQADISLKINRDKCLLDVWGRVWADVVLMSVVSLEQFESSYDFDFALVYDTKATFESQREEESEWDDDLPDIIIGGKIDLCDITIEQLALQLEDHPRKEGEIFEFEAEFDASEPLKNNPFDILSKLK